MRVDSLLLVAALFPGCTPSERPAPASRAPWADARESERLEIARFAPSDGRSWALRLERVAAPRRAGDPGDWRLASSPDGEPLVDLRADSTFVSHLLDSVASSRPSAADGGAVKRARSELGLDPPRWTLRWGTPSGSRELRLGDEAADRSGVYAAETGAGARGAIGIAGGAMLGLLGRIAAPEDLRLRRLSPESPDDVVEFRILRANGTAGGREIFFAQRQGGGWVGRDGMDHRVKAGRGLERLLRLEISRFIDDETLAGAVRARLEREAAYRVAYRLRRAPDERVLRVGRWNGRVWASADSRPGGAFELAAGALELLEPSSRW